MKDYISLVRWLFVSFGGLLLGIRGDNRLLCHCGLGRGRMGSKAGAGNVDATIYESHHSPGTGNGSTDIVDD